jgi:hypothetical protein
VTGAGSAIIASSWPHQAGFPFKATICVLSRSRAPGGQFVLHAKVLPGNPYDGHTLGAIIEATERRDTAATIPLTSSPPNPAACRSIIEAHGGRLSASGNVGPGAQFALPAQDKLRRDAAFGMWLTATDAPSRSRAWSAVLLAAALGFTRKKGNKLAGLAFVLRARKCRRALLREIAPRTGIA